jgi:ornithine cyclodeaminase
LTAVRDLTDVRVASRTPSRRDAFVERARRELDLPARAVDDVAEAVRGADVVVLATRATEPLIDVADLAPGCHVTSVGPKRVGATEIPAALLGAAAVVASDSPQQLMADPDLLTNAIDVRHVGAIASGADAGRRTADDLTVYCSAGLAGSEVLLARAALQRAAEHAYDTSG